MDGMTGWIAFGALALGCLAAGLALCRRERARRRRLLQLHREMQAFLQGGAAPDFSVEDEGMALLRNDIADLAQEILLAREQKQAFAEQTAEIISDISHQLKTPLAGMRLYCEMDAGDGSATARRQLTLIDHMERLVLELLKLEKLRANAYEMEFVPQDLRETARGQIERFRELYPHKRFSLQGECLLARFDVRWMGEAIGNVVKNACEHTAEDGKIVLCVSERDGFAWLTVQDDGGGVPENRLPALFLRFSSQSTNDKKGCGLGLAITRSILECHHGGAIAENAQEGLRVSMWLPIMAGDLADMSLQ